MTFSIPNDSLQALLENSNQAIIEQLDSLKIELEGIYETGEGSFSQEEIKQDLSNFSKILEQIENENNFDAKKNIILSEYQPMIQCLVNKYRDFLSHQAINFLDHFTKVSVGFACIAPILRNFASAYKNENINDILQTINELSKVLETYIQDLDQDTLNLIKKNASGLLLYASSPLNCDSLSQSELEQVKLSLRQVSRSILYQIEHSENEKESTIGDLAEWLKTAPSWKGDDFEECLDYINEMRK